MNVYGEVIRQLKKRYEGERNDSEEEGPSDNRPHGEAIRLLEKMKDKEEWTSLVIRKTKKSEGDRLKNQNSAFRCPYLRHFRIKNLNEKIFHSPRGQKPKVWRRGSGLGQEVASLPKNIFMKKSLFETVKFHILESSLCVNMNYMKSFHLQSWSRQWLTCGQKQKRQSMTWGREGSHESQISACVICVM